MNALWTALRTIFWPKCTTRLQDFAYTVSNFFPGGNNLRPRRNAPGTWIQTPISAWLASVPIVLVLQNDHWDTVDICLDVVEAIRPKPTANYTGVQKNVWQLTGELRGWKCLCILLGLCPWFAIVCSEVNGKHTGGVWQLKWIETEKGVADEQTEVLVSVSSDGRVTQWAIRKGFECTGKSVVIVHRFRNIIHSLLFAVIVIFAYAFFYTYRVAQKIWHIFVRLIISANIDQFSNFFHCQNGKEICSNRRASKETAGSGSCHRLIQQTV